MLKKKRKLLLIALALCMTIPAMALLKTTVFSNNKNTISSGNSTKYDVIADLGEGGRFESGEFVKLDANRWIYKYLPTNKPTPIPKPVKDGHTFEGWLVNGDPTIKPDYTIPAWNRKNINLTAKWKSSGSMLLRGSEFNSKVKSISVFNNVTQIRFVKASPHSGGVDLSEAQDGSVRGVVSGNTLTISCNGELYINPNSSNMFSGFTNVTSIAFDHLNTSKLTNMANMFSQCSKATSLPLNQIDTSNVTDMSNLFEGCVAITSLDVSNFKTSKVTNMSGMFAVSGLDSDYNYAAKLKAINGLHLLDTSNVTNMSHMFHGCVLVPSFNLLGFNTSKVTDMSYMFKGCAEVGVLDVSRFNTQNVTDMQYMFAVGKGYDHPDPNAFQNHQSKLVTIRGLQNLNTSKVTNMYRMFLTCTEMTSLDLTGLDTSNVTDMGFLFSHMYKLRNLNIRNINTQNVTNFEYLLFGCLELPSIDLSGLNTVSATKMRNMLSSCDAIRTFDVSTFDTRNVTDMEGVFSGNKNLTNIVGLNRLNMSKVRTTRSMFRSCDNLTSVNIRGWNTSSLINMHNMFRHSSNLQRIYGLENINTSSLKCTYGTFWECNSLTAEMTLMSEIPNRYGYYPGYDLMFQNCSMNSGARFTLHYKAGLRDNAQKLVDTKEYYCNVYLGNQRSAVSPFINAFKESQPQQQMSINLTLNNGPSAQYTKQVIAVENGKIPQLNPPELNPQYAGQFGGYYYDPQFTKPVKQGDIVTKDLTIYARW